MALAPVPEIVAELKAGRMVVLVDEEDRENEGDLVLAADFVTPEAINFMATHARGLVCLTLTEARCRQLALPLMTSHNRSGHGTAFTVSIEAAEGVTTGISAADRARTVRAAVARDAKPADIVHPGHVFPVMAQARRRARARRPHRGRLRPGALAGLTPAGGDLRDHEADGTMARLADLERFADEHGLKIGTIADLIHYRSRTEKLVERIAERPITTPHGTFRLVVYREKQNDATHLALVRGPIAADVETLVRVHEPLSVIDLLDAQDPTHSWTGARRDGGDRPRGRGVIVLLHRPESATSCAAARWRARRRRARSSTFATTGSARRSCATSTSGACGCSRARARCRAWRASTSR
jgi:3,4-dihydroxy 2-butanone 4-phosphate synthase/GTP cyclohydrolase II